MRKEMLCQFIGLFLLLSLTAVNAENRHNFDRYSFEKIAKHTINAIEKQNLHDIDQLIVMQEQLIELGVKGCAKYALHNPQDAKMLQLVMDKAEDMKYLSLKEIKQQWHAKRYLLKHGIEVEKLHKNSLTGSLMDTIVHPATAYIALKEFRRTGNEKLLQQVNLELSEAIFQLAYIE